MESQFIYGTLVLAHYKKVQKQITIVFSEMGIAVIALDAHTNIDCLLFFVNKIPWFFFSRRRYL